MKKNNHDFLTCAEVADLVGFSAAHIRRLVYQGAIPGEKYGPAWLIEKSYVKNIKRKRVVKKKDIKTNGISERNIKADRASN